MELSAFQTLSVLLPFAATLCDEVGSLNLLWLDNPLVGHGLLNVEASRSHSDAPHSLGLLWTSDQPDAETSN
jgi:hypothetical protein